MRRILAACSCPTLMRSKQIQPQNYISSSLTTAQQLLKIVTRIRRQIKYVRDGNTNRHEENKPKGQQESHIFLHFCRG